MKELGEYLRQERQKKGISLEAIGEETKIPLRYLAAIEDGDFARMPGEVYLKGFLRSYAETIGLDPTVVSRRYQELKEKATRAGVTGEEGSLPAERKTEELLVGIEKTVPPRARRGRQRATGRSRPSWQWYYQRRFATGVILLLLGVALGVAYGAWRGRQAASPAGDSRVAGPARPQKPGEKEPGPSHPVASGRKEDKPPLVTGAQEEATAALAPIMVTIATAERCWVEAYADGELILRRSLEKGEQERLPAERRLALLLGRPGAAQVTFGSQLLPELGKETVTVVFAPDGTWRIFPGRREDELYHRPSS